MIPAPLRHPHFRYVAAGRLVNMLGSTVAPIALAFAVLDLTGSVGDLGLVVGAASVARVVFVLFGGVVADRFPRQRVLVGTNLVAGASQATVATLVLTGTATVPALMALGVVNGVAGAFTWPAAAALTPQTVPAELYRAANALNGMVRNVGGIGGAALGGVLVAAAGPGWGLAVDAASFLLAALAFSRVRVTAPAPSISRNLLGDLREGWSEFTARTWLWAVVLGFMVLNAAVVGGVSVLGPAVADHTVGRRVWGLVLAVEAVGLLVGGLLALRVTVRRLLLLGVACMLGEVPLLLGLAVAPLAWVLVVAAFVGGLAVAQFGVAWETSLQQNVPAERMARVYSYDMLGSIVVVPVGQAVAGPVAQLLGLRTTLLAAAGLVTLAVLGMLASRDVRRLRTTDTAHGAQPGAEVVAAEAG